MFKRSLAALLCGVFLLAGMLPLPATAAAEILLYSFSFEDEAEQGGLFEPTGKSAEFTWVTGSGIGHNSDTALKAAHIDGRPYNSAENALRLTLPEPLPAGAAYRIVAWVYAPSAENPGKGTLTGPGFVLNGDYPGDQGVVKFPSNFGTLPMDTWKSVDVTIPMQEAPVNTLDFRLVINDADKHPDVWYWDGIEIYQVGDGIDVDIPEWNLTVPSLHELYKDYFLFGNILEPHLVSDPQVTEMYKAYYNVVTSENAMKPLYLAPEKDTYSFSGPDRMVDWAQKNGIPVHGHTLVWHSQSAPWMTTNADGSYLTRAEAKQNLENFINTVAGHFAGRVISWDVVNEAFTTSVGASPGNWRGELRLGGSMPENSGWYGAYANGADRDAGESGSDYIYDAFVFARLADPNAVLYYNDFNEEQPGKREVIARMTEELNEQWKTDPRNTEPNRLLIEGLGLQSHYWVEGFNIERTEDTIKRFIQTGARLSISELDIPFGNHSSYRNRTTPPTDEELAVQADYYRQMFELLIKYSDHIERVTIWGLTDNQSWRGAGYPVLFDRTLTPKPAFYSVIDVLETSPGAPIETSPPPENTSSPSPADPSDEDPSSEDAEDEPGGFPTALFGVIGGVIVIGGLGVFVTRRVKKG
ncbi:MAG: endo-1,4-beta-xylanase [Oscillospiraceae bacterium]|nr:endo-1,4-beta-xylanase [Oscillospiraceae bacterium]